MEDFPPSVAARLRELIDDERAAAWLRIDNALKLTATGGHLDHYGLTGLRTGEPAASQVFFLEGLLPLAETPTLFPSVEFANGRAADLYLHRDGNAVWAILLDVTDQRDAAQRMQQKAYDMTLLQEKEAQLNRRLETANAALTEAWHRAEEASQRIKDQNLMLESLSTKLSKYLSPQVYASIFAGKQSVEISSRRKKLTIFCSDIADFTETADNLESEELTGLLNRYLTEMSKIALEHGATIDKYVGDAILAFFGDPDTKGVREDALACVRMAIAMQRRMRELQSEWSDLGMEKPFQLRIGITTGFCTVGNFGSEDRMDYTIIGSEVNLASRLQSHADVGGILIAHETYSLVKEDIRTEELKPIQVKGFGKPIRTYRVLDIYTDLTARGNIVRHQQDGIKIEIDLARLSPDDYPLIIRVVERLLSRLNGGDRTG
jgi:class 3 adenylate cyclase